MQGKLSIALVEMLPHLELEADFPFFKDY